VFSSPPRRNLDQASALAAQAERDTLCKNRNNREEGRGSRGRGLVPLVAGMDASEILAGCPEQRAKLNFASDTNEIRRIEDLLGCGRQPAL